LKTKVTSSFQGHMIEYFWLNSYLHVFHKEDACLQVGIDPLEDIKYTNLETVMDIYKWLY
tara:strand:- start:346 stop:525 length:180 start_codon:yes stop_codon:yes gene_type:complete